MYLFRIPKRIAVSLRSFPLYYDYGAPPFKCLHVPPREWLQCRLDLATAEQTLTTNGISSVGVHAASSSGDHEEACQTGSDVQSPRSACEYSTFKSRAVLTAPFCAAAHLFWGPRRGRRRPAERRRRLWGGALRPARQGPDVAGEPPRCPDGSALRGQTHTRTAGPPPARLHDAVT